MIAFKDLSSILDFYTYVNLILHDNLHAFYPVLELFS